MMTAQAACVRDGGPRLSPGARTQAQNAGHSFAIYLRCPEVKIAAGQNTRVLANPHTTLLAAISRPKPFPVSAASADASAVAEPEVTIDNSTVLVVGDADAGMEVVRFLARAGSWVTALHRKEALRREIESLGAMLAPGDPASPDTLAKALRTNTFDAIVQFFGFGTGKGVSGTADADVANVVAAAEGAGISRFVLVVGGPENVSATAALEDLVKTRNLQWTVIHWRAAPQPAADGSSTAALAVGAIPNGSVTPSAASKLISGAIFSRNAAGEVLSVVEIGQHSSVEQFALA